MRAENGEGGRKDTEQIRLIADFLARAIPMQRRNVCLIIRNTYTWCFTPMKR
jgi:hypothetical protein